MVDSDGWGEGGGVGIDGRGGVGTDEREWGGTPGPSSSVCTHCL